MKKLCLCLETVVVFKEFNGIYKWTLNDCCQKIDSNFGRTVQRSEKYAILIKTVH